MSPFFLILILYSFLLIGAGVLLSRQVRDSADFFVANRKLGPGLLGSTLLAANLGAGTTVGAAGLGYEIGLSGWWWVGSAGIGSLFLAFFVGPRIREVAQQRNFFTVGDFLEHRYGPSVRMLITLLLWAGSLTILAGQLIAISWILEVTAGTSKAIGCILGGLVAIVYFSAGGLKATARINFLQLTVIASGFLIALPLALDFAGGLDAIKERILAASPNAAEYFHITGIGFSGISHYFLLLAPSFIVSPGLLQKIYGARSSQAVRWGAGMNALVLLGYSFVPVMFGMSAAALFPALKHRELALPTAATEMLPFWLGALLLMAVFSAEVSTVDAILFMLSTSISKDLYKAYLNPDADDRTLFSVSRWISVLSGATGVLLAIVLPSVIDALTLFYSLLSVALFAPLLFGLYASAPGKRACLTAIAVSVAISFFIQLFFQGQELSNYSVAIGIAISFAIMGSAVCRQRCRPLS